MAASLTMTTVSPALSSAPGGSDTTHMRRDTGAEGPQRLSDHSPRWALAAASASLRYSKLWTYSAFSVSPVLNGNHITKPFRYRARATSTQPPAPSGAYTDRASRPPEYLGSPDPTLIERNRTTVPTGRALARAALACSAPHCGRSVEPCPPVSAAWMAISRTKHPLSPPSGRPPVAVIRLRQYVWPSAGAYISGLVADTIRTRTVSPSETCSTTAVSQVCSASGVIALTRVPAAPSTAATRSAASSASPAARGTRARPALGP